MLRGAVKLPVGALVFPHFQLAAIKKTKNKTKRGATNASDSEHSLDVSVLLGNSVSSSSLKNPSLVHWFIVLHEKTKQNRLLVPTSVHAGKLLEHIYAFSQLKCGN